MREGRNLRNMAEIGAWGTTRGSVINGNSRILKEA